MSEESSKITFQWVTEGLLLFFISFIGLIGNFWLVVKSSRQRVQRVFHRLLLALATFDTIYIICSVLLYAFPAFIDGYTKDVKLFIIPYILPIIHIALIGSIYSTVALAAERYITICHPFMRYRSYYRGASFIVPVVTFAFLYNVPKFFELRLAWEPNSTEKGQGGGGEYRLKPTELRKDKIYIRVYLISINFVVQILIPFIVLVIFNLLTYRTIKESEKNLIQNVRIHYSSRRRAGHHRQRHTSERTEQIVLTNDIPRRLEYRQNGEHKEMQNEAQYGVRNGTQNGGDSVDECCQISLDDDYDTSTTPIQLSENKATSLRKREVILSKISIYIVFVFLFCHSLRIIPNMYEMIQTYTKEANEPLKFPPWILSFTHLSHLCITFACSANFYIYFAKYGRKNLSILNNITRQRPSNCCEDLPKDMVLLRNTSISSRSRSFFSVRRKPSNFIVNSEDPSIAMATKL